MPVIFNCSFSSRRTFFEGRKEISQGLECEKFARHWDEDLVGCHKGVHGEKIGGRRTIHRDKAKRFGERAQHAAQRAFSIEPVHELRF
jgi:hypothetical protein